MKKGGPKAPRRRRNRSVRIRNALIILLAILLFLCGSVFAVREILRASTYGWTKYEADVTCDPGTVEYYENVTGSAPYLQKRLPNGEIADEFKIISTSDMHLGGVYSDFSLEVLGRFIDKEQPDLVILCGDNVVPDKEDLSLQQAVRDLFEEKKVYWTFVLGNHDGEEVLDVMDENQSRKHAYEAMLGSPYCLARDEGGDGVFGYGNHVLNIKNSKNAIIQTLFFLDSGKNMLDEYCLEEGIENTHGYDFIKQNQIAWYKKRLSDVVAENNGVMPKSMVFTHIALAEYQTTWNKRFSKDVKYLYGDRWEQFGCSDHSSGFFDCLVEQGSTHTVVVGHDHVINMALEYKGVRLTYSLGLQYETYNRRHRCSGEKFLAFWYSIDKRASFTVDGVTAYKVLSDGTVNIMPKYAQYEGVFDGLEDRLKEVCAGNVTYRK